MFGMCKTKLSTKYKRALFIISKIDIICFRWTTPECVNYQLWTSYKIFLSLKYFFCFFLCQLLIAHFYKSTEKQLHGNILFVMFQAFRLLCAPSKRFRYIFIEENLHSVNFLKILKKELYYGPSSQTLIESAWTHHFLFLFKLCF